MSTIYCGIDFHKHTSTFCILDKEGKKLDKITTIETKNLVRYFANRKNYLIGIEASGGVNNIVDQLKASGHQVKIINPNKFKAIGIGGKKTDEKDAEIIANFLRLNYIPEVYHKSKYAREVKLLLVQREMVVRMRVNLGNHIRGVLREVGITIAQGLEQLLLNAPSCIDEVENGYIRDGLKYFMSQVLDLLNQEQSFDNRLSDFLKNDLRYEQLKSVPGVGPMTAAAMIAVVDDNKRFKDGNVFTSYLGLVPREHSSGDKRRMGAITRSGSEILRRYLIHGARSLLRFATENRKDPNQAWAVRVKSRSGFNKAVVALARRTSRICFSMMRDNRLYMQPQKEKEEIKKAA